MSLPHSFNCLRTAGSALIAVGLLFIYGCATKGTPSARNAEGAAGPATIDVPSKARTLFEQATSVLASGDFVEAEFRFKQFLLQYPDYPGAYVNLAIVYANNNEHEAIRAALEAALEIDSEFVPALNQLGLMHRRNGRFVEAEAAYLKAVTVSPGYALAHYNLGVLNELYMQRLDVALEHFERYQDLVGNDRQVEKWIADLKRRVAADRRAANLAD